MFACAFRFCCFCCCCCCLLLLFASAAAATTALLLVLLGVSFFSCQLPCKNAVRNWPVGTNTNNHRRHKCTWWLQDVCMRCCCCSCCRAPTKEYKRTRTQWCIADWLLQVLTSRLITPITSILVYAYYTNNGRKMYMPQACCLDIKPFFLSNDISSTHKCTWWLRGDSKMYVCAAAVAPAVVLRRKNINVPVLNDA